MLYKLGAVSYLNALPLTHYLTERPVLAPPAPLVRLLRLGEVDIATAPIVTLFENPDYTLVPGVCIASNGPVKSVKLFFTKPGLTLENVRSIYLDMESRTSAYLLKVLLKCKYGRNLDDIVFYHPLPPCDVEAKLLIGDKVLQQVVEFPSVDLGEEWTSWTKLPFVYAAWISRLSDVSDRAREELIEARDKGVAHLSSVIPLKAPFPTSFIEDYLRNLVYTLGPREEEGMGLFRDYLLQADLIACKTDLPKLAIR